MTLQNQEQAAIHELRASFSVPGDDDQHAERKRILKE
jgi:hypothetical protein